MWSIHIYIYIVNVRYNKLLLALLEVFRTGSAHIHTKKLMAKVVMSSMNTNANFSHKKYWLYVYCNAGAVEHNLCQRTQTDMSTTDSHKHICERPFAQKIINQFQQHMLDNVCGKFCIVFKPQRQSLGDNKAKQKYKATVL